MIGRGHLRARKAFIGALLTALFVLAVYHREAVLEWAGKDAHSALAAWAQALLSALAIGVGFLYGDVQHKRDQLAVAVRDLTNDVHRLRVVAAAVDQLGISANGIAVHMGPHVLTGSLSSPGNVQWAAWQVHYNDARALLSDLPLFDIPDGPAGLEVVELRRLGRLAAEAFKANSNPVPHLLALSVRADQAKGAIESAIHERLAELKRLAR